MVNRIIGLGIDAGGTFTDAVIYDLTGSRLLAKNKAHTTKWNYAEGVRKALAGLDAGLLVSVSMVALSTTLATNAIVENRGRKVGLLFMPPYGLFEPGDIPYEPKALISGQLEITGTPIEPVNEEEVVRLARRMVDRFKVEAFAVSGYAGVINPDHETTVKRILRTETGLDVSCGHELSDILNFRTRAYTAIMNASIIPLLTRLLDDVRQVLRRFGIQAPVMVVRGDGTLMRDEAALEKPVETILSGPAASVAGAQHLTGRRDAIVVDMGGTTTDAAVLREGRVETSDSGSCVGGHKTHVRALQIRTLGLGGDSFISWRRYNLKIGPERIVPVAWLGGNVEGVDRALDYYSERPEIYRADTARLQLLFRQGNGNDSHLTAQESEILGLLDERAYGMQELAERIGMSYWSPQIVARLEANHRIQRCGFTPTDVLHCSGDIAIWDANASRRMCGLLGVVIGKSVEQAVDELKRELIRLFAMVLFKRQLDEAVDPELLESCAVCRELVGNIFGEKRQGYDLDLRMHMPVIGIGAPVHVFLPKAASFLNAEYILPEHADVANAVGAVVSKVIIRRHAEIRAYQGVFRIEGLPGARKFTDLTEAREWTENSLVRLVREIALKSGTNETGVEVQTENKVHTMPNGKPLFMGCCFTVVLQGTPVFRSLG